MPGIFRGARFVTLQQITTTPAGTPPLSLEMSPPEVLRTQLAALGISNDSHVVIYVPKDSIQTATRAVFTMIYAGLDNVSLLDGGLPAWVKSGHDVTTAVPPAKTGTMGPITPKPLVVDADFVQSHLKAPGFIVVDARDAAFYDGTMIGGPTDHRVAGHIAGAHSLPFNQMVTADVQLKYEGRARSALHQGRRQAGRHGRRVLPHRSAGDDDAVCREDAGPPNPAVRRVVRGLGAARAAGRESVQEGQLER